MTENIIETMTFNFALEIIKLCKKLKENKEYQFNNQLFRSGTSIGANVHEAESAFSKREFVYKLSISLKEARETRYWLLILKESKTLDDKDIQHNLKEVESIFNILSRIITTTKQKYDLNNFKSYILHFTSRNKNLQTKKGRILRPFLV